MARVRFRVIAVVLLCGAAFHFVAALLPALGESIGSPAPTWRHLLFASVESALAMLILRRAPGLPFVFALFLGQQITTHGVDLRQQWALERRIDWVSLAVLAFLSYVLLECVMDRRRQPRSLAQRS